MSHTARVPGERTLWFFRKLWGGLPTCGGVVYPAYPGTWQSPGWVVHIFISGGERTPVKHAFVGS